MDVVVDARMRRVLRSWRIGVAAGVVDVLHIAASGVSLRAGIVVAIVMTVWVGIQDLQAAVAVVRMRTCIEAT